MDPGVSRIWRRSCGSPTACSPGTKWKERIVANRILLHAFIGSHPLAALSSFGLLNLATSWDPTVRLGFVLQDDWVAFLESDRFNTLDELIVTLCAWMQSDAIDRVLGWQVEDVRVQPSEYRSELTKRLAEGD